VRPFASSLTAEKRCPITEFVNALSDRASTMESQMKAAGSSEDDVKARLKDLRELIGNIKPKTVYIYNAADKAGEVGLLELKSTAHKKMKELMNKYITDYNQDPTSLGSADDDSGVWFNVTRTGTYYETEYNVEKFQILIKNGAKRSFEDDRSPLPENVVDNYDNLAYDLSSVYQAKTYDDLDQILQANLASLVEMVPDADLNVTPSLSAIPVAKAPTTKVAASATKPVAKSTAKVTTKIGGDDEDESEAVSTPVAKATSVKASAANSEEDEFMAAADAILNG
jgi:hypothetical protein